MKHLREPLLIEVSPKTMVFALATVASAWIAPLPAAAAIRMLVEELRVELPGEPDDNAKVRARDERSEAEYERRAEGVPAQEAAVIALAIAERADRTTSVAPAVPAKTTR
jgi:hypothetical protein